MKNIFSNSLVKSTGVYAISNILNAAIPFLLLPYLTDKLSPSDYGIVSMFQVLFSIFNPFVGLSSESAISKRFFDLDKEKLGVYNFNVFLIQVFTVLPLVLVIVIFGSLISDISDFPKIWLWAVLLYSLTNKFLEIIFSLFRLENKAAGFGALKVSKTLVELGFTFYFISLLNQTWDGRISAQVISSIILALIGAYLIWKKNYFKLQFSKLNIKDALKYGVPLIPHVIGATLITYADRLFITNMVGLQDLGVYSVGYQVGMGIGLIQTSINQAYIPWLFGKLKNPESFDKKKLVRGIYAYNFFLLALVFILVILVPFLFKYFIGDEFQNASNYVLWIGLAFAINGMYKMVVAFLFYTEQTKIIGLGTIVTAMINIVLNYFFISKFGAIGAAYATTISFLIQYLTIWYFSHKYYKMPWFNFI